MNLAFGIRKLGFRKWYERQLLQSHAAMALAFICLIGVMASFESVTKASGWPDTLADIVTLLVCGATGLWALRRYLQLLSYANAVASQADCPSCGVYARFKLIRAEGSGEQAVVACRGCDHHWTING